MPHPSIATSATVPHYYASFSVDFNQQVFKSNNQAKIHISEVNGSRTTRVLSLVASTSKSVLVEQHPTHDSHYRLTFSIPERLKVGQRYAITLDSGVVVGTQSCVGGGVPSEGLTDTSVWQFVTDHTIGEKPKDVPLMLPYGKSENDNQLTLGDGLSCHSQRLATASNGYPLWGNQHSGVTICENGLILFDRDQSIRHPQVFPGQWATQPTMLAPYWSSADNRYSRTLPDGQRSHVWYHFYERGAPSDRDMLQDIESIVVAKERLAGPSFQFTPTWGAVVTWERITPYPSRYQYQLYNTFQGVLASDGLRSYAIYIYDPNSIQWSVPATLDPYAKFGHAVSGYSTPTRNHVDSRSGTFRIAHIDNRVNTSDPNLLPSGSAGAMYVYKLYNANTFSGPRQRCLTWYASQPEPTTWLQHLDPCPCTLKQARADPRFEQLKKLLPRMCFQNSVPSVNGSSQECCYRTQQPGQGAFIEGAPDGGNSVRFSWLSYEPITVSSQETLPYQWCCKDEALCPLFWEKRPSKTCTGYEPQYFGFAALPLAQAVNSGQFLVDAPGAFLLLRAPGDLRIEAVSAQASPGAVPGVTGVGLTAEDADTVVVDVSDNGTLVFSVNGMPLTNKVIRVYSDEDENITVECLHGIRQRIVFDNGLTSDFSVIQPGNSIRTSVSVPQASLNCTGGLLCGSTLSSTRKGALVSATRSAPHIAQWRLQCNELQVVSDPRCLGDPPSSAPIVPTVPKADDFLDKAKEVCGNDMLCQKLANVTGDLQRTKAIIKIVDDEGQKDKDANDGPFPVRTATPTIRCMRGICNIDLPELAGIDGGKNFTSVWVDRDNSSFQVLNEDNANNRYVFALKRNSPATSIQCVVFDGDGRVVLIRPIVFICDCDHGVCTNETSKLSSARTHIYTCECPPAYDGDYCQLDRDGCRAAYQPCSGGVPCVDRPAPATGFQCAACPPGFSGDGVGCFDLDECKDISPSPCTQQCVNTQGSYQCACNSGFQLAADDVECDDLDECSLKTDECSQTCRNTVGSYVCGCFAGFILNGTTDCTPLLPCRNGGGCEQLCSQDAAFTPVCSCRAGYEVDALLPILCDDIDECNSSPTSPCDGLCVNTDGSFQCACQDGYNLAVDQVTCQDIDECIGSDPVCSGDMLCTNTRGSYQCSCQTGYHFDQSSQSCQAVSCGQPPVATHGVISGTEYTYGETVVHSCDVGYTLSGDQTTQCLESGQWSLAVSPTCEIVHCPMLTLSPRTQSSSADTSFSSVWRMHCSPGYSLNGADTLQCLPTGQWDNPPPACDQDIDECNSSATSPCDGLCVNTDGSFQCACQDGYNLALDQVTCQAVSCGQPPVPTHGVISGTEYTYGGTVVYSCDVGYTLSGDQTTQCLESGQWSLAVSPATCEIVHCPTLTLSPRTQSSSTDTSFSSVWRMHCSPGYSLNGADTLQCLPTGQWDNPPPTCDQDIDECNSSPTSPCDGLCINTDGSFQCACQDGYNLALDQVTCQDIDECIGSGPVCSGDMLCTNTQGSYQCSCQTGYHFDQSSQSCQAVSCGEPPVPTHGVISGTEYTYGETVVYSCDVGYTLSGDQTTQCLESGQWSLAVSPTCEIVHCPTLTLSPRTQSSSTDTSFSSVWRLHCSPGYSLNGADTLQCLPTGQWDNPPPTCDQDILDCVIGNWSMWSACSVTCLNGLQTRERDITLPPTGLGKQCPDTCTREIRSCRPREDCGCDDSPIGTQKAIHTTGNAAADVIIVVDESNSMQTSHQWLSGMIPQLEQSLLSAGIGVQSTLRNHYALVGYGRNVLPGGDDRYVLPHAFGNAAGEKVFTIDSFSHAISQLTTGGNIEDGYLAVRFALENLTDSNGDNMLRLKQPNVATNVILVTDEDRDAYGPGKDITRKTFKKLIRRSGALLNVVVDQRFGSSGESRNAMGVDSKKVAYFDQPLGTFVSRSGGSASSDYYLMTKRHYTTVALNMGGAAWDIRILSAGGTVSSSFTSAFLNVKTSEIADQIEKCRYCTCVDGGRTSRWACTIAGNQDECKADASQP
ncbi:uncharacterized protein LOC135810490 [Sycon ciliatum]|uniref:uncharacterized protein LOC135810490 n=1 Tax=Sycon ciliatum TaxID=27933 RepID=UPI0031F6A518